MLALETCTKGSGSMKGVIKTYYSDGLHGGMRTDARVHGPEG